EAFDAVILDYRMPEMDGLTLATRIRELPGGGDLPLIMLTSITAPLPDATIADLQFAAHLYKPVKPSQLYDNLATIFDLHEAPEHISHKRRAHMEFDTTLGERFP